MNQKTALIAGASRGLGLALTGEMLSRGWTVVATVRSTLHFPQSLPELQHCFQNSCIVEQLDLTDLAQIVALRKRMATRSFELILANGGMRTSDVEVRMLDLSDGEYIKLMCTNALGPIRLLESFADAVTDTGVLSVMSSILGSMTENPGGLWPAYAASKAALNMLLHAFARSTGFRKTVVAMSPGWVRTEMGGDDADLSLAESIPQVAELLSHAGRRKGLVYLNYDGRELAC